MSSLLTILMFVILLATVGVLYTDGLWSNAVRLINVVTAGLLAMNFFEPVARWLDDWNASYTYVWDFLSIWTLFIVFMVIFSQITNHVSKVQVRYIKVADQIGGIFLSLWIGWIMVCFTMTTLHTAPLARNFLFNGFQPQERMVLSFAPDRQWLGFMQKESQGAFARSATPEEEKKEKFVFDPDAAFMPNYNARRETLEKNVATKNSIVVGN
jgi:uncharacterized membrane protein required for colicin V production